VGRPRIPVHSSSRNWVALSRLRASLGFEEAARKTPEIKFDPETVKTIGEALVRLGRKLEAAADDPKKVKKLTASVLMTVAVIAYRLNKPAVSTVLTNQAKRLDPSAE